MNSSRIPCGERLPGWFSAFAMSAAVPPIDFHILYGTRFDAIPTCEWCLVHDTTEGLVKRIRDAFCLWPRGILPPR